MDLAIYLTRVRDSRPPIAGHWLSWTAPTTNTDGSPLTGGDAIDRYRLEWGTVISGEWGYFVNSLVTEDTFILAAPDIPPGNYAWRVVAIAVDGEESDPTDLGLKAVA